MRHKCRLAKFGVSRVEDIRRNVKTDKNALGAVLEIPAPNRVTGIIAIDELIDTGTGDGIHVCCGGYLFRG